MLPFFISTAIIVLIFLTLSFIQLAILKIISSDKRINILINKTEKITINSGKKLLEGLQENDLFISSGCAGKGTCGQCKVKMMNNNSPVSPFDKNFSTLKEIREGIRLSCQLKLYENSEVTIKGGIVKGTKKCIIEDVETLSPTVKKILLTQENSPLDILPGQFLQLKIPPYNDLERLSEDIIFKDLDAYFFNDDECFRSYSVSNSPEEKTGYILTVRIALSNDPEIPAGRGSSYLFSLKKGDAIDVVGPFNDFPATTENKELCFVAGGVGIAPLRSHIYFLLKSDYKNKIFLFFGVRNSKEILYRDDFEKLEKDYNNFTFVPVVSDHDMDWEKDRGMVNQVLEDKYLSIHEEPEESLFYMCGPEKMIEATNYSLDKYGVDEENIFYENF